MAASVGLGRGALCRVLRSSPSPARVEGLASGATRICPGSRRVNKIQEKNHACFYSRDFSREDILAVMSSHRDRDGSWTLLTGHGRVLVEIARNPEARIRDISPVVGLTDRTVQAIVADLEAAGYLTRTRAGRRTRYNVKPDSLFRHAAQEGHRIGPFLALLAATGDASEPTDSFTKPTSVHPNPTGSDTAGAGRSRAPRP